jgi:hypothetical protein
VEHAERRLHHAHDVHVVRRVGPDHLHLEVMDHGRALDLGQQDGVGAAAGDGREVLVAPGRIERVDAHDQFALAVAAGLDGRDHLLARQRLGVGRDGVLEVEDQRIGRQAARLLERARVGAGHVEYGTARPGGFVHGLSPLSYSCLGTRPRTINPGPPVAR